NAGEIGAEFQMTGASVSHHLSLLKAAGLVRNEKKGQQVIYTLDTTVLQDLMIWVNDLKGGNK
ncbi:MAG: helix-turn-helix transcriptional regulator, partial [Spirochaetia bacterium]|nr:helix-turn-helix transcriptional regulator [Spirochaetia bacterium]